MPSRRILWRSKPGGNRLIQLVSDYQTMQEWPIHRAPTYYAGHTVYAASPALADVQAAVARANPGDRVLIPAGFATWAGQLVMTYGVVLIGAGIGRTVITSAYDAPDPGHGLLPINYLFAYTPTHPEANEPFRLGQMTIDCQGKCSPLAIVNFTLSPINRIRADHLDVLNSLVLIGRGLYYPGAHLYGPMNKCCLIRGTVYGVSDHCTWSGADFSGYDTDDGAWAHLTFEHGTADNFYIEDCVFTVPTGLAIASGQSGRYAIRHCTMIYDGSAYGATAYFAEAHGNMGSDKPYAHMDNGHSTMGMEFSNNTFIYTGTSTPGGTVCFDQRGGKVICYGNRYQNVKTAAFIRCREDYYDDGCPVIGGGAGAVNAISGQPQHPSDSYFWDNRRSGDSTDPMYFKYPGSDGSAPGTIGWTSYGLDYNAHYLPDGITLQPIAPFRWVPLPDLDFWMEKTPFTGASGMGTGLRSSRPASCTLEGAGYWATDEQRLYRWHSGAWETHYVPYPYPHPLCSDPIVGD
jgi:hypothetical protein